MTANGGQRRTELVRDAHEEVALLTLRIRQTRCHLPEAAGKVPDLTAAADVWKVDVVASASDLVRGPGERQHGSRDAARQVPPEQSRDDDAAERRDREPLEQRDQLMVQLRLRLRNDQVAEHRSLRLELQGTRDREV